MNFKTSRTKCLSLKTPINTKYTTSLALIYEIYPYRATEQNLSFIKYVYTYPALLKTEAIAWNKLCLLPKLLQK